MKSVTTRDLIHQAGQHPVALAVALATPPLVALLVGRLHDRGRGGAGPWKYLYAVLVYLACVPGMFAGVLTAYTQFFSQQFLLQLHILRRCQRFCLQLGSKQFLLQA